MEKSEGPRTEWGFRREGRGGGPLETKDSGLHVKGTHPGACCSLQDDVLGTQTKPWKELFSQMSHPSCSECFFEFIQNFPGYGDRSQHFCNENGMTVENPGALPQEWRGAAAVGRARPRPHRARKNPRIKH